MDKEDNGPVVLGVTWFLCALSAVFLALRLYAKISRRQGLWWDDYILTMSWLLLAVESAITQATRELGMGRHVWTIELEDAFALARLIYIAATISCFAATLSKISFGVTLLRLTKGKLYLFVWFSIISLFVLMLPSAFLSWLQCRPAAKLWNPFLEGDCWSGSPVRTYGFFNAAFCATVDFALALIPWKLLLGLQLQKKEKFGVAVAMSMGLLAGVCAIVKGVYLQQVNDPDFFYNGKDVTIWTAVETATAIIGACIPVLRVFFKNTITSLHDRYRRTEEEDKSAGNRAWGHAAVQLSFLNGRISIRSSVRSIPGAGELGTVISDDYGGILPNVHREGRVHTSWGGY